MEEKKGTTFKVFLIGEMITITDCYVFCCVMLVKKNTHQGVFPAFLASWEASFHPLASCCRRQEVLVGGKTAELHQRKSILELQLPSNQDQLLPWWNSRRHAVHHRRNTRHHWRHSCKIKAHDFCPLLDEAANALTFYLRVLSFLCRSLE